MGKEAEQHPVSSLFVDFVEEGNKFHYHFAFNPIFAEKMWLISLRDCLFYKQNIDLVLFWTARF